MGFLKGLLGLGVTAGAAFAVCRDGVPPLSPPEPPESVEVPPESSEVGAAMTAGTGGRSLATSSRPRVSVPVPTRAARTAHMPTSTTAATPQGRDRRRPVSVGCVGSVAAVPGTTIGSLPPTIAPHRRQNRSPGIACRPH